MTDEEKMRAFFENARMLSDAFGIVPLLYGSLGLACRTGEELHADDIDVLIPGVFLQERWPSFLCALAQRGYALIDAHEHEFEKDGVHYAYAQIEEIEPFAGVRVADIPLLEREGVRFRLLTLEQYLKVYAASSRDGYRIEVRNKKDLEKIEFIRNRLAAEPSFL